MLGNQQPPRRLELCFRGSGASHARRRRGAAVATFHAVDAIPGGIAVIDAAVPIDGDSRRSAGRWKPRHTIGNLPREKWQGDQLQGAVGAQLQAIPMEVRPGAAAVQIAKVGGVRSHGVSPLHQSTPPASRSGSLRRAWKWSSGPTRRAAEPALERSGKRRSAPSGWPGSAPVHRNPSPWRSGHSQSRPAEGPSEPGAALPETCGRRRFALCSRGPCGNTPRRRTLWSGPS